MASSLDPRRTFLQLLDEKQLPDDVVTAIKRYKFRGSSGKVNLALSELPKFPKIPEEALRGATSHAARALGFEDRGVLAAGKRADFVIWNIERPADLCYWIGGALAAEVAIGGDFV